MLHLLCTAGGISIPCSYTSHVAPISSPKLHMEVTFCKDKDKVYICLSLFSSFSVAADINVSKSLCLEPVTQLCLGSHDTIHQTFSLHICTLQVIRNWNCGGRPGNEANRSVCVVYPHYYCTSGIIAISVVWICITRL